MRAALDAEGFRPSKTLGQNFLRDPNLVRAIAADSGVGEGDRVLEVGVGCGFLTTALLERGAELLAVEIDSRLARVARRLVGDHERLRLVEADVLAGKHELAPEVADALPTEGPWHVVSNLPYGVSGPLLVVLTRLANPPTTLTVLLQREVAERITAGPGQSAWGPLGLRLAPLYTSRRGRRVGPELFWPRPRVESAVVHLQRRPDAPGPGELAAFDRLVGALFQQRRKSLRGGLAALASGREDVGALLEAAGLSGGERPEELYLDAWRRLAAAVGENP